MFPSRAPFFLDGGGTSRFPHTPLHTVMHRRTEDTQVSLEDELFQRFAPVLRALCLKAAPAGGIVPRWLLKILVLRVQQKAERHNRRIRLETLKQDKKLQTMLGFAGSKR